MTKKRAQGRALGYWSWLFLFLNITLFVVGCAGSLLLRGPSPVATSRGYSLVMVHRFLIVGLVLFGVQALEQEGFNSCSSWASTVVIPGL